MSPSRLCPRFLRRLRRSSRTAGERRIHGRAFARTVRADGRITVDDRRSAVKQRLAGQGVNLIGHAPDKVFDLFHGTQRINRLPLKGRYGKVLPLEDYVTLMRQEAHWDGPRPQLTSHGFHQVSLWA